MAVTAAEVQKLRKMTGAGMMECKKALEAADGDFEKAVESLRIAGAAKAAKRSERQASNGLVASSGNALVELRCETDFVAKNADFEALAGRIADAVAAERPADAEALAAVTLDDGRTVAETITEQTAVIGEKLEVGDFALLDGDVAVYLHRRSANLPPAVGVLVGYQGDEQLAKSVAMQVAAMRPQFLSRDDVPAETVANERRIAEATAREEGKPEQALPKIVEGRLNGYFKETVLLDQPSVTENKKTVGAVLDGGGTTVTGFARIEVGQA